MDKEKYIPLNKTDLEFVAEERDRIRQFGVVRNPGGSMMFGQPRIRNPDKAVIMTDNGDTMGVNTWKAEQAALAKATPSVKPSHSVQAKATQSVQAKQISAEECFELLNKPSACQRA